MTTGRPRTTTPEDKELIELGKELLAWATEECDELRYHLNQWWCLKNGYTKDHWDLMCDKKSFHPYYERARVALAARYVDGSINATIASRFLRLYFPDMMKNENDLVKLKAELARKQEQEDDDNGVRKIAQVVKAINGENE